MRVPGRLSAGLVPGGEPFLLRGGPTACVLVHGFTAMPAELRPLGDDLAAAGYTVLGLRLGGHGTHPRDLARARWRDWLADVDDALALVAGAGAERVVLVGQSLGAMVALTAAATRPVAGVVALSVPGELPPPRLRDLLVRPRLLPKPGVEAHPELGVRREAGYPAYAAEHTRVRHELLLLARARTAALPEIAVPALLVSSEDDPWCPPAAARWVLERLRTPRRELVAVSGPGHGIAIDPLRGEAVAAILRFLGEL